MLKDVNFGGSIGGNLRRSYALAVAASAIASGIATASSAATPAGTIISNIAEVRGNTGASALVQLSNRVDIRVDEIVDFSVTPAPACAPLGANRIAAGFVITNLGNGPERFVPGMPIARPASAFRLQGVYADSNDNGCYDSGIDTLIPPGTPTASVVPGGRIRVFVVGDGTGDPVDISLPVTAETGPGRTGTTVAGGGQGGGDAVIGNSGGSVTGDWTPTALQAILVKSQSVRATDGSAAPRRGAIITYHIEGRFAGVGTAMGAVIGDSIPAGTTYVSGSLTLDDAPYSDAAGFSGQAVAVPLGNVSAPAVRSIAFQVRIN